MATHFSRLSPQERQKLGQRIGEYVSHVVVAPAGWGNLRSVAELNALDRYELARDWYYRQQKDKWRHEWLTGILCYYCDREHFLDDVAVYIDKRIPMAYQKHLERNGDKAPSQYNIKPLARTGWLPHGLRYHYQKNYK